MFGRSIRSLATSRRALAMVALAVVASAPSSARAQRVLGGGSDAVTLPRGTFRVGLGGESMLQRDRWRDGRLEGLGGSITADAFGPLQFSLLAPVEQLVRQLGVSGFAASLGSTRLDARQRVFATPLSIEYGVTDWLTLGARATVVRTKAESQFRIRTDSGRATLGVNPYFLGLAVPTDNATTIGAYVSAAQSLSARRDACQANAGSFPECATILAELADVSALMSRTSSFASGLTTLYGAGLVRGQRYVPLVGSAAQAAMLARVDSLRTAFERYGVTAVTAATGLPLAAQVPLAAEDLDRLVTDSLDGYGAKRLDKGGLTQIGDVHLGAMVRLHDSFATGGTSRFTEGARGWRQALMMDLRLGTGYAARPARFLDQGTGTGTSAVTVRSITDVVVSGTFWTTFAVGYTKGFVSDQQLRVPSDTGAAWLEWWRETTVPVTPGGQLDVELSPRWHLNDYIALGAQWTFRSNAADRHDIDSTATTPYGATVPLLGRILDEQSKATEQRIGLTATYSTLASIARGRRGPAFELSYVHQQSVASGTGIVPKQWEDRLLLRYYARFLGR